jgi:exosortase A-associated hydrolase 1
MSRASSCEAEEVPLVLDCGGRACVAILHRPARSSGLGVLIVVGGPQYRVGPHRHFVELARDLAAAGHAVLRFDHRGIGDTTAEHPGFEAIGPDVATAVDTLRRHASQVRGVVLWGLCDSVPAICAHAGADPRIAGLVLVNPWVRDAASHDRTLMRHYYLRRPLRRDFWGRLLTGRSDLGDFARRAARSLARKLPGGFAPAAARPATLAGRLVADLARFDGPVRLVLSGHDITAREFETAAAAQPGWASVVSRPEVSRQDVAEADHTFTDPALRRELTTATLAWLATRAHALAMADAPATRTADGDRTPARSAARPAAATSYTHDRASVS